MNIQEAKEAIKQTISIYLTKDELGSYKIPLYRQRPIFLLGAPGIGKTAIMAQLASELNLGLVSYSMTHHTRQSALGLPFIAEKNYDGKTYKVSEYTMSEIIASIYDTIEKSGKKEGILFLDEINCVSETLAPAILEFLQYKVFGRHHIPEGWVVITAGNPPEYNKSVREMDLATLDRLKILEVDEDYTIWRTYAKKAGIHGAITNYLDLQKKDFYRIETTVDGKEYVTARGWEDLSESLYLYEAHGFKVTEAFIYQYLHHPQVAKRFSTYYELYQAYKEAYDISGILAGLYQDKEIERLKEAGFDEKLSLVGLLVGAINEKSNRYQETADYLECLMAILKEIKTSLDEEPLQVVLADAITNTYKTRQSLLESGGLSKVKNKVYLQAIHFLEEMAVRLQKENQFDRGFSLLKAGFDALVDQWEKEGDVIASDISFAISFTKAHFSDGELFLIFLTELSTHEAIARLIAEREVVSYYEHKALLKQFDEGARLQNRAKNHFKNEF